MPTPPDDKKKLDLPEDALIPEQDVKPLADELDAILAEGPPLEDEAADPVVDEEVVVEEAPIGDLDMTPLIDMLGATPERAQMLYDAAQQLEKTMGKSPEELAQMIVEDFDILMQLEMIAARDEGGAMGGPPADDTMPLPTEMPGAAPGEMELI